MRANQFLKLLAKKSFHFKNIKNFGAISHHDAHGNEHEGEHHLKIDMKKTYLGTNDKVEEFTAIYGFKDTNDDFHIDNTDPYAHVKAKGIFSIQGLYLSDAFATLDENEPLFNLPHGYLTYDDPMDIRNLMERPSIETMLILTLAMFFICIFGSMSLNAIPNYVQLYRENLTAEYLEDEIRKIRIENKVLEDRIDELKNQS